MPIEKLFQEIGRLHLEVMHLQEQLKAAQDQLAASKSVPPVPATEPAQ